MVRIIVMTFGQGLGVALFLVGLYWLVGIAWTTTLAGLGLLAVCTLGELAGSPVRRRRARATRTRQEA